MSGKSKSKSLLISFIAYICHILFRHTPMVHCTYIAHWQVNWPFLNTISVRTFFDKMLVFERSMKKTQLLKTRYIPNSISCKSKFIFIDHADSYFVSVSYKCFLFLSHLLCSLSFPSSWSWKADSEIDSVLEKQAQQIAHLVEGSFSLLLSSLG